MKKYLLSAVLAAFVFSFSPVALAAEANLKTEQLEPIFGKKKGKKVKASKSKSGKKMKLRKGKTVNRG